MRGVVSLVFVIFLVSGCKKDHEFPGYVGVKCDSIDIYAGDFYGTYEYWELDSVDTIWSEPVDTMVSVLNISDSARCALSFTAMTTASLYFRPNSLERLNDPVHLTTSELRISRVVRANVYGVPYITERIIKEEKFYGIKQ